MVSYWSYREKLMSTSITMKKIPAGLHDDIKASAVRHRRSINDDRRQEL
jgi:plasmid stability protein